MKTFFDHILFQNISYRKFFSDFVKKNLIRIRIGSGFSNSPDTDQVSAKNLDPDSIRNTGLSWT